MRLLPVTLVAALLVLSTPRLPDSAVYAQGDPHAYFNALIARSDFYKGYSLRPNPQVTSPSNPYYGGQLNSDDGGGLHAADCNPATADQAYRYSPATDPDPHRQDAAKGAIPAFAERGICEGEVLTQPMSASASGSPEKIYANAVTSTYGPAMQRHLRIDNEIMRLRACTLAEGGDGLRAYISGANALCVIRGQHGTTASAHSTGTKVKLSVNQISNYLRPSLTTQDGNTYLITWDAYWTDSYLGVGSWDSAQKTFQFTGADNGKLFEPKLIFGSTGFSGFDPVRHIAIVRARSYQAVNTGQTTWAQTNGNTMGPGPTASTDLAPRDGTFVIKPNVWTRWWVRVEQRANDWDYFDMWVADENTAPVLIYGRVPMSVSQGKPAQTLAAFWFEQGNSSTEFLRGNLRDLVSYYRNWVVLRNPQDVPSLLLRPLAGVPPPPTSTLLPPTGVRVIR